MYIYACNGSKVIHNYTNMQEKKPFFLHIDSKDALKEAAERHLRIRQTAGTAAPQAARRSQPPPPPGFTAAMPGGRRQTKKAKNPNVRLLVFLRSRMGLNQRPHD